MNELKTISKERKEELKKMNFGSLQSTEEYKYFIENYVTSQSRLMNEEVEYILKRSYEDNDAPYSYDDITNFYHIDYEELEYTLKNNYENEFNDWLKENKLSLNEYTNKDLKVCTENLGLDINDYEKQQEIYQWFLMDERIINQLEERGEPTLNDVYWGRTCCGQHISMDNVIIEIFKEWFLNLYGVVEK